MGCRGLIITAQSRKRARHPEKRPCLGALVFSLPGKMVGAFKRLQGLLWLTLVEQAATKSGESHRLSRHPLASQRLIYRLRVYAPGSGGRHAEILGGSGVALQLGQSGEAE